MKSSYASAKELLTDPENIVAYEAVIGRFVVISTRTGDFTGAIGVAIEYGQTSDPTDTTYQLTTITLRLSDNTLKTYTLRYGDYFVKASVYLQWATSQTGSNPS